MCYVDIDQLRVVQPLRLMTFELLSPYGFNTYIVDELIGAFDKPPGTSFFSDTHRVTVDRGTLIISALAEEESQAMIWNEGVPSIQFRNTLLRLTAAAHLPWQFDPTAAYFDMHDLVFPLVVRNWQQGDAFMPFGMDNFKKVSDFFIDQKVAGPEKLRIPILVNGNGDILWVGGMRQDNRYKVSDSTKKVAIFEMLSHGSEELLS